MTLKSFSMPLQQTVPYNREYTDDLRAIFLNKDCQEAGSFMLFRLQTNLFT